MNPWESRKANRWAAALALIAVTLPAASRGQDAAAQRDPVISRVLAKKPAVDPKVVAMYYPWYGLQAKSGADRHVEKVDLQAKSIGNFTHYPAAGPYDSTDPVVVTRHLEQLKSAGVDALACSWWGRGDFTDGAFLKLMPLARKQGLQVCLYLEQIPAALSNPTVLAQEISTLVGTVGQDPAYLKVAGRPVFFVYFRAAEQLGAEGWAEVLTLVNQNVKTSAVAIVDGAGFPESLVFDGLHFNNVAHLFSGPGAPAAQRHSDIAMKITRTARRRDRIAVVTVIPGYDDRKVAPNGYEVPRDNGQFYRASWQAALGALPDWVFVRSFNQWHDGTEIEPSTEHGDLYLKITAENAARFKEQARKRVAR